MVSLLLQLLLLPSSSSVIDAVFGLFGLSCDCFGARERSVDGGAANQLRGHLREIFSHGGNAQKGSTRARRVVWIKLVAVSYTHLTLPMKA